MLVFDLSQWDCAQWWASGCYNMTQTGYFDGCNADRVYQLSFNGVCNDTNEEYKENKFKIMKTLQKQLNDSESGALWVNDGVGQISGVRGTAFERWGNFESAIFDMNNATSENSNIMVKAHAGYCDKNGGGNCGCVGQALINDLATFLVCAKKYTYFNCNQGWSLNASNYGWYQEYGKPLGKPNQENGVKVDDTYYRSFSTGTGVIFNVTSGQGRIFWSDEWDSQVLKIFNDRINDWDEYISNMNMNENFDLRLVNKRRVYISQMDIWL